MISTSAAGRCLRCGVVVALVGGGTMNVGDSPRNRAAVYTHVIRVITGMSMLQGLRLVWKCSEERRDEFSSGVATTINSCCVCVRKASWRPICLVYILLRSIVTPTAVVVHRIRVDVNAFSFLR